MARKKKDPTPVLPELDANRHHDTRNNIPTEELRDFVAEDESKPPKILYPRDPSLDPQLVWKGKDEQDREPLDVDIVPIYIQEVIEPRVIIDAVQTRKRTKPETSGFLPSFFDDFDAMDFDRKIEFNQHDQKWANRMILGNSLHVMTSLAEKEGLKGNVQMISIDPPYGIRFGSNWQISTRKRDVKDGKLEDASRQPEQVRAFRDTWSLGINSYLSYMRDRLSGARELLTDHASVFLQIGDDNLHLARCIMDEVFGSQNYLRQSASSADKDSSSSADSSRPPPDIRKGFVYKRVPHVTLKSIANNPDIKEGMTRAEIDAAIRRHAETETLYDQPYEDKNRIRVSRIGEAYSTRQHTAVKSLVQELVV